MTCKPIFSALSAFAVLALIAPPPAHAYLDLGTGSYLFQIGVATGLGALAAVGTFWAGIRIRLGRLLRRDSRD